VCRDRAHGAFTGCHDSCGPGWCVFLGNDIDRRRQGTSCNAISSDPSASCTEALCPGGLCVHMSSLACLDGIMTGAVHWMVRCEYMMMAGVEWDLHCVTIWCFGWLGALATDCNYCWISIIGDACHSVHCCKLGASREMRCHHSMRIRQGVHR
jgi:hypothetical protein